MRYNPTQIIACPVAPVPSSRARTASNAPKRLASHKKIMDITPQKSKPTRPSTVQRHNLPPPPRTPPIRRALQTMPRCRRHSTRRAHILPAVTASKGAGFDSTAHVHVHIYIHGVVCAVQGRVAVVAARDVRVGLWLLGLDRKNGLDGGCGELFPERV
jgi:hypothetical protein